MVITIGIDVSKKQLDVYVHPVGSLFSVDNDETGVAALIERLGPTKLKTRKNWLAEPAAAIVAV